MMMFDGKGHRGYHRLFFGYPSILCMSMSTHDRWAVQCRQGKAANGLEAFICRAAVFRGHGDQGETRNRGGGW
jgi:hypothetical protein